MLEVFERHFYVMHGFLTTSSNQLTYRRYEFIAQFFFHALRFCLVAIWSGFWTIGWFLTISTGNGETLDLSNNYLINWNEMHALLIHSVDICFQDTSEVIDSIPVIYMKVSSLVHDIRSQHIFIAIWRGFWTILSSHWYMFSRGKGGGKMLYHGQSFCLHNNYLINWKGSSLSF